MNKKSQVTVFVIVGIVIVVAIFLVFYFLGDRVKKDTDVEVVFDESSLDPVGDLVGRCIEQSTNIALEKIGRQGGLIYINPENSVSFNYPEDDEETIDSVAYHYRLGVNYAITRRVEGELHDYVLDDLKSGNCINPESIEREGFRVEGGVLSDMELEVSIGDERVIMDLGYPITITKGEVSISKSSFTETFDVPLGRFMDVAEDVVDYQISRIGGFYLSRDEYLANRPGLVVSPRHFAMGEGSEVYRIYNINDDYFFQVAMQI